MMERRQKWLEAQFRRQDESLSKFARQLQVLQDFISLNFDSYTQYALERESKNIENSSTTNSTAYQDQPNYNTNNSPLLLLNRMTPLQQAQPDNYNNRSSVGLSSNVSSSAVALTSDYEDTTMDPAPGDDRVVSPDGLVTAAAAVDLSTCSSSGHHHHHRSESRGVYTRHHHADEQVEPNSTTTSTFPEYGYYHHTRGGVNLETDLSNSSGLMVVDEGPTDLSKVKFGKVEDLESHHHGSILGGILTSHIIGVQHQQQQSDKIKVEIPEDPDDYYTTVTRNEDDAKQYSSQYSWGAGVVTSGGLVTPDVGRGMDLSNNNEERTKRGKKRKVKDKECKKQCKSNVGGGKKRVYTKRVKKGPVDESKVPACSTSSCSNRRKGESSNSSTTSSKQCRFCGKTFQWLHSVKTHERLHTGVKPYGCKICGARFTQNGNLKVHAKTCVDKHVESYKGRGVSICTVCTEMFGSVGELMEHQKSHDRMQWGVKDKTCGVCGEVFQKRSWLLSHEREVHGSGSGQQGEGQQGGDSNSSVVGNHPVCGTGLTLDE